MVKNPIEPIALAPINIDRIEADGLVLTLDPPLVLEVTVDEGTEPPLWIVRDPGLDLMIGAESQEALVDEIGSHLAFMWAEYAQEDGERLSPAAQRLRETLLARMRAS